MNRKEIKIIGGGICGLATAISLKSKGINYHIYEQNPEITYENVGVGISANIFPLLKEWGIFDETKEIGAEIKQFHFVGRNMKYYNSFELEKAPLSVNRRLLYKLFLDKLDSDKITTNTFRKPSDFLDEDIVISADGIYSNSRKNRFPKLELRDSQQILWRGISKVKLDDSFKNAYHDFVGSNLRFAIIHAGKDYYSWYVVKEKNQSESVCVDKHYLKTIFKDYHSVIHDVLDASEEIYFAELLDIKPSSRKKLSWFDKNNLLIGDSIHPTTPNLANGACLAMEDGYLLAELLSNKSLSTAEAFEQFQKKRTKKVNPIIIRSWIMGKLTHQKTVWMNFLLKIGIKLTTGWMFRNVYSKVLISIKND